MTTNWQHSESFAVTNLKMLENEDLCDVTIVAGNEQKQTKCHKFVRMSKSGLQEVLKLETFNSSECELYVACKRWAAQRCRAAGKQETDDHLRQELGDELISLIRFPTMTLEEFTNCVAFENVLNKDELLSVYRSIGKQDNVSQFIYKHRLVSTITCLFVRCERVPNTSWTYKSGKQDGLSFTVSKDCELAGVDMFLPSTEGSVTGVLELLEGTKVIQTQNVTLPYNKDVNHLLVSLDTRLYLNSKNEYSVRQVLTGTSTFACGSAKTNIMMKGVTMTLSNLKVGNSDNGTSVSGGQFYGFELVIKTKK